MLTQTRVVDNRVFLLGLDELYREKMKLHERGGLLNAARTTCGALGVEPQNGPVEGYYSEDEFLTEYFQRMRALQEVLADLFHDTLPAAVPAHAEVFWNAHDESNIYGRCVGLGFDDSVRPMRQYHWAVTVAAGGFVVRDFWSEELWTTERYRTALGAPKTLPFPV